MLNTKSLRLGEATGTLDLTSSDGAVGNQAGAMPHTWCLGFNALQNVPVFHALCVLYRTKGFGAIELKSYRNPKRHRNARSFPLGSGFDWGLESYLGSEQDFRPVLVGVQEARLATVSFGVRTREGLQCPLSRQDVSTVVELRCDHIEI